MFLRYGRFPVFFRGFYDETGLNFEPKNARGYVEKGTRDVTFIGDRKDMSKRQFTTINAYRGLLPTPEQNLEYAKELLGETAFADLSRREIDILKNPQQPFIAVVFPCKPKIVSPRGRASYVDSRFPASKKIRDEMRSWPKHKIKYYFSPRGNFFFFIMCKRGNHSIVSMFVEVLTMPMFSFGL